DRLTVSLNLNGWIDTSDNQIPQFFAASPRVATQASPALFTQPSPRRNARQADWDAGRDFERDNKMGQAILRVDYEVADKVTLTSLSNYAYAKIHSVFDNDGTSLGLSYVTTSGHVEAFNQEFRLAGQFGGALVVLARLRRFITEFGDAALVVGAARFERDPHACEVGNLLGVLGLAGQQVEVALRVRQAKQQFAFGHDEA
ncbi:hypothetical protein LTR94_031023, partial [Friedmanniomyces endolithicus]